MSNINGILNEREKTHGDINEGAPVYRLLKRAFYTGKNNIDDFSSIQEQVLDAIFMKIARISCGDPNFIDHWQDIVGYATLAVKELEKNEGSENGNK